MKDGWEEKRLEKVCVLQRGYDLPTHSRKEGNFPLVSSNGITDRIDLWKVSAPGVVTGRSGTIGNLHFIEEAFWPLNTALYVKDFCGNDERFVYYLLKQFDLKKYSSGAGVPTLNRNNVHDILICIPKDKAEQQRIAAILDESFTAIAKATENAERNLQNAKELFESYLERLLGDKGKDWEESKLHLVCKEIFAGGDAPKDNMSEIRTDKYRIPILANAVKDKGLYGYTDRSRVNEPAITIAARGSGTGYTEIRREPFFPIVRLIVLIPNVEKTSVDYLKYCVRNFNILSSGSAIPQLTVPMISDYQISYPPLAKQSIIVQKLDTLSEECKKLEAIYQKKLDDLEELKKVILRKAFSGELKTNDVAV